MVMPIPPGKTIIHSTNDPMDIGKSYSPDYAILGDARLVLAQFIDVLKQLTSGKSTDTNNGPAGAIANKRREWLDQWRRVLTSSETPINPYRVIHEFMQVIDPSKAIVTHDSGSPRYQMMPFYQSDGPRTYLGWGKSHALGTGLGLAIGAKLAAPEKLCVNFMGDAAFGMTGLDFETAVRSDLPILTIVLNNSSMAIETHHMELSPRMYATRDIGGNYADIGRALGGWAEQVSDPNGIGAAIERAKQATEAGHAALLEIITSEETDLSFLRPFT